MASGTIKNLLSKVFVTDIRLTSSNDMNNIDDGIYYQLNTEAPTNSPVDGSSIPYGAVIIQIRGYDTRVQIWCSRNTLSIYYRMGSYGTPTWNWNAWKKITAT